MKDNTAEQLQDQNLPEASVEAPAPATATAQLVTLGQGKQAQTTGNIYFLGTVNLKNGDKVEAREVRVTVNPRWKPAYEEAIKTATRCKQPSFNVYVTDMERGEKDYNGTGSTWASRVDAEKGSLHRGNFVFQSVNYELTIERAGNASEFTLGLLELAPISLTDL